MRAVWNIKEEKWKFRQHDKGNMKYKKSRIRRLGKYENEVGMTYKRIEYEN